MRSFEIDAALQRIEEGSYGICEMSGRPIPVARLRAIPFARFTVECQTRIEEQSENSFADQDYLPRPSPSRTKRRIDDSQEGAKSAIEAAD